MDSQNRNQVKAVILTKSAMRKGDVSGSCVTAYELKSQRLVRFVSRPDGSPIPYSVSDRFHTLDLIRVSVLEPCPVGPQTENLLVNPNSFQRIRPCDGGAVRYICEHHQSPRVPSFVQDPYEKMDSAKGYAHSLEILRVEDLTIWKVVSRDGSVRGKASFHCEYGNRHRYSVTDPAYDIRKTDRRFWTVGDAYIVASIPAAPFTPRGEKVGYFKFVAAIYPDGE